MKKRRTNKAKRVLKSCRNHGTCDWCKDNRLYQARREESKASYNEAGCQTKYSDDESIEGWRIQQDILTAYDEMY